MNSLRTVRSDAVQSRCRLLLVVVLLTLVSMAVSASAETLVRIRVVGVTSVQPEQVIGWTGLEPGQQITREGMSAGVRRLTATGNFSEVFAYQAPTDGGIELILNITEYPRLAGLAFAGNKKLKEEDLREGLTLKVGDFISPGAVTRTLFTVRDKYQEEGYYNAEVTTDSTVMVAAGRQTLVVNIVENNKVEVSKITFVGNDHLSADDLKDGWETKEDRWWRGGTFKPKEFQADLAKVMDTYRNKGFLDAEVITHRKVLDDDSGKLELQVEVREGIQYMVGDVSWGGNSVISDERIEGVIPLESGKVYSQSDFDEAMQNLSQIYWEEGYIYLTVEPSRSIDGNLVNVHFEFREGRPAEVHDLFITGNTKTHESVIRRELRVQPGDRFVSSRLQDSVRRVFQLGFFEDIVPDFKPATADGDIDLVLDVKEKQTGQFSMGMGFSQQSQATGFLQIGETNLFGRGQALQFSWQFGQRRNFLDLSYTQPWFMGTPTLVGIDIFNRFSNQLRDFYDTRVKGFAFRLGRPIPGTRYSRASIRYGFSLTTLSNFDPTYTSTLDQLEREFGETSLQRLDRVNYPQSRSSFTISLSRNSTDNPFFPNNGSSSLLRYELNGGPLGGDLDFHKVLGNYDWYQLITGKFVFHLGTFAGVLQRFGDTPYVPDFEKFRLGGNRFYGLRGYRDLEVVPRGNLSFVGGQFFATITTEIVYPVTRSVHLLAFVDQGDTWNTFDEADLTNLRKGAGFGIRLEVPLVGRVGLDYGYGFNRFNPGWEAHFNFGSFF